MQNTDTDRSYTTAQILTPAARRMGTPSDGQLATINARAAVTLTADQVFVFDAVASTDAVDSYFTRMDIATTLPAFVRDFQAGRSLLDSHEIFELPLGASVDAVLEPIANAEGSDATTQVRTTFYLLRDHTVNGNQTNDYIRGIEAGLTRRMSVGFGGPRERWVSEQDGKDLWDSQYYPGQRLSDGTRAVFRVIDAGAYECSLVFMNATPGALVQRMQQLVTERAIPAADLTFLEQAWHVRFDRPARQHLMGGTNMEWTAQRVLEHVTQRVGKTLSQATRGKLTAAHDSMEGAIDAIADLLATADAEAEEGRALKAQLGERVLADVLIEAEAGRAYRTTQEERARAARIAVQGSDFDADKYARLLGKLDLDELETEAARWEDRKSETFYTGRKVAPADPTAKPAGAYQVVRR